jgi:hypothetical protein
MRQKKDRNKKAKNQRKQDTAAQLTKISSVTKFKADIYRVKYKPFNDIKGLYVSNS